MNPTQPSVRQQLNKILPIVSIAYLSQKYFGRSRSWMAQKINGSIVNGKPASFTSQEIETLNRALKDISKEIGSIQIP